MCSRREADRLIEQGRVTINGRKAVLGQRVDANDEVVVDSQKIQVKKDRIYMAFNKPVGITSTTDPKDPTNIIRYIDYHERLFPIGRLDKDSEGLIFLTNDGNIVNKMLRAGNAHEKEYVVSVNKPITPAYIKEMSEGVSILGKKTLPCTVIQTGKDQFRIILVQGLNRQIRRMSEALGYRVTALKRIRIMNTRLDTLKPGKWRLLTPLEVDALQKAIAKSVNSEAASKRIKGFEVPNRKGKTPAAERTAGLPPGRPVAASARKTTRPATVPAKSARPGAKDEVKRSGSAVPRKDTTRPKPSRTSQPRNGKSKRR